MSAPKLTDFSLNFEVKSYKRSPVWIIGPRSYFSDRAVPQLEVSAVPARIIPKATASIIAQLNPQVGPSYWRRLEKIRAFPRSLSAIELDSSRYHLDLRPFGLGNWSLCLNQALPVAVKTKEYLTSIGYKPPILLLNSETSQKIKAFFYFLGFEFICLNDSVLGPLITFQASDPNAIRRLARDFICPVTPRVNEMVKSVSVSFPKNIFLNRRNTRTIINMNSIRPLLDKHNFQEIFPEEHSLEEQFAMQLRAERIVAIHGAALAPLLFRNTSHGKFQLIEIHTPGHLVPPYRDMTEGLACDYRLVRGIPTPEMCQTAFDNPEKPSMSFTSAHSLKPFKIDPESLRVALELAQTSTFPLNLVDPQVW
jgi:hypothetical protein